MAEDIVLVSLDTKILGATDFEINYFSLAAENCGAQEAQGNKGSMAEHLSLFRNERVRRTTTCQSANLSEHYNQ